MSYISLIWVHGLLPADGGRWLVEGLFGDKIRRRCEAEKTRPLLRDKERFVGEENCDLWPYYCFSSQFSGQKIWLWYDTFGTNVNLGWIWGLQKGWQPYGIISWRLMRSRGHRKCWWLSIQFLLGCWTMSGPNWWTDVTIVVPSFFII